MRRIDINLSAGSERRCSATCQDGPFAPETAGIPMAPCVYHSGIAAMLSTAQMPNQLRLSAQAVVSAFRRRWQHAWMQMRRSCWCWIFKHHGAAPVD